MEQHFPKTLEYFFQTDDNHYNDEFSTLDYNQTPWVVLDHKFEKCNELIDIVTMLSTGHVRNFLDGYYQNLSVYDIYGPTDKKEYRSHIHDDDTSNINQFIDFEFTNKLYKTNSIISELFNLLPYKKIYEITVNKLEPGGYIIPHKDVHGKWKSGLQDQIIIPLYTPDNCFFKFWGVGEVPTLDGVPVVLNTYKYLNAVMNKSKEDRYLLHIVGDIHTQNMYDLIQKSFDKMKKSS